MRAMREIPPPTQRRRQSGFTLIELMIAVAVVSLLAMVALPSYQDSIRKSRRSEAFSAIAAVQQAQERSRGNFPSYCANLTASASLGTCGLNLPATTANGRYTLAVNVSDSNSYTVTATAQSGQASDTRCALLAASVSGGAVKFGSAASAVDWNAADSDVNRCWAK